MGLMQDVTGSKFTGLCLIAGMPTMGALLSLLLKRGHGQAVGVAVVLTQDAPAPVPLL